jgi:RNA polymerase sigma-70 factor (ECF subfamily)
MEDKEIIERIIRHGDTKCYAEIVKRYSGTIYSKVLRLVKQSDMAKDITQQAFIRAYSNLDTWRGAWRMDKCHCDASGFEPS